MERTYVRQVFIPGGSLLLLLIFLTLKFHLTLQAGVCTNGNEMCFAAAMTFIWTTLRAEEQSYRSFILLCKYTPFFQVCNKRSFYNLQRLKYFVAYPLWQNKSPSKIPADC